MIKLIIGFLCFIPAITIVYLQPISAVAGLVMGIFAFMGSILVILDWDCLNQNIYK